MQSISILYAADRLACQFLEKPIHNDKEHPRSSLRRKRRLSRIIEKPIGFLPKMTTV
jgi:hypothetical protein